MSRLYLAVWICVLLVLSLTVTVDSPGQTFTLLYTFTGGRDGGQPVAPLARDNAGNLYGTTNSGGDLSCGNGKGCGTVFKLTGTRETVLHRFSGPPDGEFPSGPVLLTNNALYGTTDEGGLCDGGCGTVFKLNASGESVLYRFTGGSDGLYPGGPLVRDAAGNLYGTTDQGGSSNCQGLFTSGCGVVFKVDPLGNESVFYSFMGAADGSSPDGLTGDGAGNLYGGTLDGGDLTCSAPSGCGVIFEVNVNGVESVRYTFHGIDGAHPSAGVVRDGAGNFFGTTSAGGTNNLGTVFKRNTAGTETVLHNFTGGADGAQPFSTVVGDQNGNAYGTTAHGGSGCNCGVVFKLDKTGTFSVLWTFLGGSDGAYPMAGLLVDPSGNLYGVTSGAGDDGFGTVFELIP